MKCLILVASNTCIHQFADYQKFLESFESLGALSNLITGINADSPTEADLMIIVKKIKEAIKDIRENGTDLSNRLTSKYASESGRIATNQVRKKLEEQWN